jgi:hypothetical protein
MFSLTPRRFTRKWICALATAIAAAAIAVTVLAGSAFATPNSVIGKLTPPSDTDVQFGGQGSCAANQDPAADADLDWRENLAEGTVQPKLTGSVCLQSTTGTYRVALELYYLGPAHVKIGSYHSLPAMGNGAAVNDFAVNLQGPKVLSAAIHHVHVQLQKQVGGVWQDVSGVDSFGTAGY